MLTGVQSVLTLANSSNGDCTEEVVRNSCVLGEADIGQRDAVVLLRLFTSALSFLGAFSIIYSAIRKRQVLSPKVHPIFVFSIADVMLSMLWISGSALWILRTHNMRRGWCFAASLITIILECVVINLTLVYAVLSYSSVKKLMSASEQNVYEDNPHLSGIGEYPCSVWHPFKSTAVYILAWCLPIILVMIPFAVITSTGHFHILDHVKRCTCWCSPSFGNAVPYVGGTSRATALYVHELRKILTMYGVVVSAHYIVVFTALMIVYYKLLKVIADTKNMQANAYQGIRPQLYETVKFKLEMYQSQTKRRVASYIVVFVVTGIFNFIMSLWIIVYESQELDRDRHSVSKRIQPDPRVTLVLFCLQSITLPLQGFFNAIVYGWTQEDFVGVVGDKDAPDENAALIQNIPVDIERSINVNDEEQNSPLYPYDATLTVSRSVAYRESLEMSGSIKNNLDEVTDYHSETEDEFNLETTSVSVH